MDSIVLTLSVSFITIGIIVYFMTLLLHFLISLDKDTKFKKYSIAKVKFYLSKKYQIEENLFIFLESKKTWDKKFILYVIASPKGIIKVLINRSNREILYDIPGIYTNEQGEKEV